VRLDGFVETEQMREAGVRRGEQVVVNLQLAVFGKVLTAEIVRRLKRHVAFGTGRLGFIRIIEASRPMPRNAAQKVRIPVILPAEKLLVVV
jgi:hypothetical protein